MNYRTYSHCRISESENLVNFFHFETPLAGGFLKEETDFKNEKIYPLTLSFCPDSYLVQVNEVIDGDLLFRDYFYKTGTIGSLVKHFKSLSEIVLDRFPDKKSILEFGCNDFTLLKNFIGTNFQKIIGVDPSNISRENKPEEIKLFNDFFTHELAEEIKANEGEVDIVSTSNSFAHIEDIRNVTKGISYILSENGTLIIEVHWLGSLIKNLQFPFVYHEHMYYYSLGSISNLLNQYGLEVYDIEKVDTHGGSMRLFCGKIGIHKITQSVDDFRKDEISLGLYESSTFVDFTERVNYLKKQTLELLEDLSEKIVYGYGASGQANTLMAYYGITKKHIPFIIDDSPIKIGCYTPGNHIPIVSSEKLNDNPDYILCFAYTFYKEISSKTDTQVDWIIPLPKLVLIEKKNE